MSDQLEEIKALLAEQARQLAELRAELTGKRVNRPAKRRRRRVTRSIDLSEVGTPSEVDMAWARRRLRQDTTR